MSYYGGTSALDAYTGALTGYGGGGSSRYESLLDRKPYSSTTYSSDYSLSGSSGRGNKTSDSAYDKYCRGDYLSELTGLRTSAYTTPYRPPDTSYVDDILSDVYSSSKHRSTTPIPSSSSANFLTSRRKYVFEPESVDLLSNKFGTQSLYKTSGGYSNNSNGSSSSYRNDNDSIGYSSKRVSSRIGAIGSAPSYDRFGKELSNYERWKISQGSTLDDESNNNRKNTRRNNDTSSTNSTDNSHSSFESKSNSNDGYREVVITTNGNRVERDLRDHGRNSMGRTRTTERDDMTNGGGLRSGSRLHKEREFSVIPTTSSSLRDWDDPKTPSITGSRFSGTSSNMTSTTAATTTAGANRKSSPPSSSYFPTVSSTSSSSYGNRSTHSFPSDVRSKLVNYDVRDVKGDGGCYYRCLSVYFTGSEESYNTYRREVMSYIKQNLENYSSMIKSEVGYASTNDYFSRKTRSDRQEFAETTEIIATCCVYNINIHVLAVVPGGRRSWEWLHFDPSIGNGKPSTATRDVYLYNQGSVHFMLCSPK